MMDKDELWSEALSLLLENVDENDPTTVFLNMISPVGIFGDQFVLVAENTAVEDWLRKNYLNEMQQVVLQVSDVPLSIGLGTSSSQTAQPQTHASAQPSAQDPMNFPIPQPVSVEQNTGASEPEWLNHYVDPASLSASNMSNEQSENSIRPGSVAHQKNVMGNDSANFAKCTFGTFVVGESNRWAHNAAIAVAEQPGVAYNPLFIYGNSGLGKTHLLIAIANYVMQNFPHMKTRYVKANDFVQDYVNATQSNKWDDFNAKYYRMDVLLLDDVQILEGKTETINQLFNIIDEMRGRGSQIVLSADRAPKDIKMHERMITRFGADLIVNVTPPDYETRLAILQKYLSRLNQQGNIYVDIPNDVLSFLAEAAPPNIREMEGAIGTLVSNMSLLGKDTITVEEVQELFKDSFFSNRDKQITIDLIQSEVERFFEVSHEDLISSKRSKNIMIPRHIAIYLSRYMTEESLQEIGKKFGNRDHTTMIHSVKKIEASLKEDRNLFDQLERLRIIINERA